MRQIREWVTFWVLAIVLWGPSFLLIKVALRELEPVMVVALRIRWALRAAGRCCCGSALRCQARRAGCWR